MPLDKVVPEMPYVVCLCGSTKFYEYFQRANFQETMKGRIVLSVGFYPHASEEWGKKVHGESVGITPEQKIKLDELHKRKIDMADEVFILNVGGYIGESTTSELVYAMISQKPIKFLEWCNRCGHPFLINEQGFCRICRLQTEITHDTDGRHI